MAKNINKYKLMIDGCTIAEIIEDKAMEKSSLAKIDLLTTAYKNGEEFIKDINKELESSFPLDSEVKIVYNVNKKEGEADIAYFDQRDIRKISKSVMENDGSKYYINVEDKTFLKFIDDFIKAYFANKKFRSNIKNNTKLEKLNDYMKTYYYKNDNFNMQKIIKYLSNYKCFREVSLSLKKYTKDKSEMENELKKIKNKIKTIDFDSKDLAKNYPNAHYDDLNNLVSEESNYNIPSLISQLGKMYPELTMYELEELAEKIKNEEEETYDVEFEYYNNDDSETEKKQETEVPGVKKENYNISDRIAQLSIEYPELTMYELEQLNQKLIEEEESYVNNESTKVK